MRITYLCDKHAEWVYSHPVEALHYLDRDSVQGEMLVRDGRVREAIPYLGCAFDIACVLNELEEGGTRKMAAKMVSLALSLHRIYQHIGAAEHAVAILFRAASYLAPDQPADATTLTADSLLSLVWAGPKSASICQDNLLPKH